MKWWGLLRQDDGMQDNSRMYLHHCKKSNVLAYSYTQVCSTVTFHSKTSRSALSLLACTWTCTYLVYQAIYLQCIFLTRWHTTTRSVILTISVWPSLRTHSEFSSSLPDANQLLNHNQSHLLELAATLLLLYYAFCSALSSFTCFCKKETKQIVSFPFDVSFAFFMVKF